LFIRLSRADVGCYIGKIFASALCYVDDITLIGPSRRSLSLLLGTYENYAKQYRVKINSTKNVLITYNVRYDVSFELNAIWITHNNFSLHLSHYIGDEYNKRNVTREINNLITNTNTMISRLGCDPINVKMSFKKIILY